MCWWHGTGRQTREHCFKECLAWKPEIRKLWKEVREASVERDGASNTNVNNGRKGLGNGICRGRAGPGNTAIRDLLGDERFSEAVLSF